jgi:hypothetical protein
MPSVMLVAAPAEPGADDAKAAGVLAADEQAAATNAAPTARLASENKRELGRMMHFSWIRIRWILLRRPLLIEGVHHEYGA